MKWTGESNSTSNPMSPTSENPAADAKSCARAPNCTVFAVRAKYASQVSRGLLPVPNAIATRGNAVSFGDFGLKSIDRGRLTARQIEAARRAISRHVKRGGRIWIRVFPDKPISHKPAEVRMGNGKGNPEYYVAEIQPGKIVFEIVGVPEELAREAFRLAAAKLPLRTTFVARQLGA